MYVIAAAGIIILITCTVLLVTPLFGWRYMYNAAESPITVDISKAGRYTFFIRRYRFFRLIHSSKRNINFSVAIFDARDETEIISTHSMSSTTASVGYAIFKVGQFCIPYPGKFTIVSLSENRFMDNDKIIIKKHVSRLRILLLSLGIVISPHMFTSGLAGGLVSLGGIFIGIILLALNL